MRLFASRVRPSRRILTTLATVLALMALMLPVGASVAGSTFDAGDGDLLLANASGPPDVTDWENAPALQTSVDLPTGQSDNSFGEGTKEDTAVPTVVSGAIPNNKSDLTRLYVSHEKIGTSVFLYLAWERVQEPTGTTNMDFEFNKNKCTPGVDDGVDVCSSNGVTPTRTPGDVLIKYDLSQGGTNPVLGYHVWIDATNAPAGSAGANCESNNKYPCWDKAHAIAGTNFEASINTVPVTDPIAPGAPRTLSARTFGEAAINLVGANILPAPGQNCKSFGSAFLKSRASDSFTAAVKDFIAPLPVSVSNCGTLRVRKQTNPQLGTSSPSFGFSTTGGNQLDASFSLKDDGVYVKLLTVG
jgi:hypothetical protein